MSCCPTCGTPDKIWRVIEEGGQKVTHLSDSYIAHKLVTLEAQLARYEVIGTVEQIRAVIKWAKETELLLDKTHSLLVAMMKDLKK